MIVGDDAIGPHDGRSAERDRGGAFRRNHLVVFENERGRDGERCCAGRVSARITVGASLDAGPWRTFAEVTELERAMDEPSKPRGGGNRTRAMLVSPLHPMGGQVCDRDVPTGEADRKQRLEGDPQWIEPGLLGKSANSPIQLGRLVEIEPVGECCESDRGDEGRRESAQGSGG